MTPPEPAALCRQVTNAHTVAVLDAQHTRLCCDLHLMSDSTRPQAVIGLCDLVGTLALAR